MPEAIKKEARLFRAGTYPRKGAGGSDFVVTVEDLQRIAAGTTTAAVIHAHDEKHERLDYGVVDGSSLQVRGNELWGTLSLDADAVPFLERNGLKGLSAGIPFDKSRLHEVSFTRNPTIQDAAMFSEESPGVAFFSLETFATDAILDDLIATFAGKTISTASAEKITAAHDALANLHPDCCPANGDTAKMSDTPAKGHKHMSFWKRQTGKSDPTPEEEKQAKEEFHAAIKEIVPAPVDTTAQFAEMAKKSDILDAKTFGLEMLSAGKIIPAQMQTVVAEFADAAEDDRMAPKVVTFSVGTESKTGTRVEKVRAKYENAVPHSLTKELLPETAMFALFNPTGKETAADVEARRDAEYQRLIQNTPLAKN